MGLRIDDRGASARPKIYVTVFHDGRFDRHDRNYVNNELTWRFHLDADLREFDRRMRRDARFAPIFRRWRGMRASNPYTLYEPTIVE